MNGKSKGILLQVAYKGVIDSGREVDEVNVVGDYNLLVGLMDKLGIDPDEGRSTSGGGGGTRTPKPKPEGVTTFTYNGQQWFDYRQAKASGAAKKGHPDFKSADGKSSTWLYSSDGEPNADAAPIAHAADTAVF